MHRLPYGRGSEKGSLFPNRDRKGVGAFLKPGAGKGPILLWTRGSKTPGDDVVNGWIKRQADVSSRNFKVHPGVFGDAVAPIHHPIGASINGGLGDALWQVAAQRVQKLARAAPGITVRQYALAVL